MTTFDTWLLFGHILSAIVWLGGGFTLSVLASRAQGSSDPNSVVEFARTLSFVGPRVLGPATLGTVGFGIWLVAASQSWDFSQRWIHIGLGLFILAFLIGAAYLSRVGIKLQRAANEGATGATETRALLGRWVLGYRLIVLLLLIALWDMVFKPGL